MTKLIQRKLTDVLLNDINKRFISIIVGPRQVGKTTLLNMLIRKIEKKGYKKIIYLNLDDITIRARLSRDPVELRKEIERRIGEPLTRIKDKLFLIIDEAQKSPPVFEQVKIIYDNFADKVKIFLSGSSSMDIQRGTSETLAGRVRVYRLMGFSLGEILKDRGFLPDSSGVVKDIISDNFSVSKTKKIHSQIWPHQESVNVFIEKMLLFGSLPAVHIEPEEEEQWFILRDYISVYLERDIRTLTQVGNLEQFRQVYSSLMFQNGGMLNINNIASDLGMSRDTVRKYLDIMQSSFLIYKISPYSKRIKIRATKAPKLYFFDQGIVNHTLRLTSIEALKSAQKLGTAMETLVLNEIISEGFNLALPPEVSYLRDYQGHELDFVFKNKTTSIVEVTTSSTIGKKKWRNLNYFAKYLKNANIFLVGNFEEFQEIKKKDKNLYIIPIWLWF